MPRLSPVPSSPLKPLVFQVLLALVDGEGTARGSDRQEASEGRHGWSLVREVQQRGGFDQIMPGNFYRTLRTMLADGLIEEVRPRPSNDPDDERRRYFRLTPAGARAAAAEARRLEALVLESRAKRLLTKRG
jgi:DNA-binding PadR family transcriptional regulator